METQGILTLTLRHYELETEELYRLSQTLNKYNNANSIIEAQSWKLDQDGSILLTSNVSKVISHSKAFTAPTC